jgi:hypothetical protein
VKFTPPKLLDEDEEDKHLQSPFVLVYTFEKISDANCCGAHFFKKKNGIEETILVQLFQ